MKKPFLLALVAAVYIVFIVLSINTFSSFLPENHIIIPIVMLGLLVLSVAVMAFLFFYEPVQLLIEKRQKEALKLFTQTVGFFTCFVIAFVLILFFSNK